MIKQLVLFQLFKFVLNLLAHSIRHVRPPRASRPFSICIDFFIALSLSLVVLALCWNSIRCESTQFVQKKLTKDDYRRLEYFASAQSHFSFLFDEYDARRQGHHILLPQTTDERVAKEKECNKFSPMDLFS